MECPQCHTANPEVARFCLRCGLNLLAKDQLRREHYAVHPNEPVASFAIVSTIMPHGSGTRPYTYRIALLLALAFPVIGAVFGLLSFAVVTAAFAVPVVYIVYIYDVNLWEDEPVNVTVMAFLFTGLLALGWTVLWREVLFKDLKIAGSLLAGTPVLKEILVLCLLVPVVAVLLMQLGPLFLASRPAFDDLMDGLTFGVISGVAYAAFETLIVNRDIIVRSPVHTTNVDAALWVSIVFTSGLIKPLVYGTATGIACAEYSGLGEGYDGLSPRYFRGLAEALVAIVVYQLGFYLFGLVKGASGSLLGMLWGLVVAAVLVLRVRNILHTGLMEAALESAARDTAAKHATKEIGFCSHCEMPLIDGSLFCVSCGNSVRAVSKTARRLNAQPGHPRVVGGTPPSGGEAPAGGSVAVDEAPGDQNPSDDAKEGE